MKDALERWLLDKKHPTESEEINVASNHLTDQFSAGVSVKTDLKAKIIDATACSPRRVPSDQEEL